MLICYVDWLLKTFFFYTGHQKESVVYDFLLNYTAFFVVCWIYLTIENVGQLSSTGEVAAWMLVHRASGVLWEKPHEDHPSTNNQIQVAFLSLEKGACLLEWSWCGDFYINSTPKHHVQGNCVAEFSVPSPSSQSRWMRNTIIVYNLMYHKVLMLILSYGVHYKTCYFTTSIWKPSFLHVGAEV